MNKTNKQYQFVRKILKRLTFASKDYWERRYARGGDSGSGSYNNIASYKSEIVNGFIKKENIKKMLDFGCGDGNQCGYFNASMYMGVDVSETAVQLCKKKYENDPSKIFLQLTKDSIKHINAFGSDLTLSLDVIFHLVEDKIFEAYIYNLFTSSPHFVMIFSTNKDERVNIHHKNRYFTKYIEDNFSNWELIQFIENPYKGKDSQADFYIYKRNHADK